MEKVAERGPISKVSDTLHPLPTPPLKLVESSLSGVSSCCDGGPAKEGEDSSKQLPLKRFMFNNSTTNFSRGVVWCKWRNNWWVDAEPYANFLKSVGLFEDVSWCCTEAYATTCSNCGSVIYKGVYCGRRRYCPICAGRYSWRKTEQVMRLLDEVSKKLPNLYVVNINFTVPMWIWELDPYRVFEGLSRVIRNTLRRYFRGLELGVLCEFQEWHSEDPLGGFYPHAHTFMLNYGLDEKTGEFKRLNSKISEYKFKKIYREELEREFGEIKGRVNVWFHFYSYKRDRMELEHAIYYAFRLPVHDVVKFFVESGRTWELDESEASWLWELLTLDITRTRWFGFLSCSRRGAFRWFIRKLPKNWDRCPYCGARLDGWVRVSGEELEDLLVDRPPPLK